MQKIGVITEISRVKIENATHIFLNTLFYYNYALLIQVFIFNQLKLEKEHKSELVHYETFDLRIQRDY